MVIKVFSDQAQDQEQWDAYVQQHAEATHDHLWLWRSVLKKSFGYRAEYLGAIEGDRLVGILPLYRVPQGFKGGCAYVSIPFGNYGGILADTHEVELFLLNAAKQRVHEGKAEHLDLRHSKPVDDSELQPIRLHNRFVTPLDSDAETLFSNIGRNNRNKIRKSQKLMEIKKSRDLKELYKLHLSTTRRLGTPCFPKSYYQNILDAFGEKAFIHYAYFEGKVAAFDLCLVFKDNLITQFNGSYYEYQKMKPNNLLYWQGVETGCALGLKRLDLCRSRIDSGSAAHKRELRMQEIPLAYQVYQPEGKPFSAKSPSNPKYQFAINTWKRLPVSLTRLLGPQIVRYLA